MQRLLEFADEGMNFSVEIEAIVDKFSQSTTRPSYKKAFSKNGSKLRLRNIKALISLFLNIWFDTAQDPLSQLVYATRPLPSWPSPIRNYV